MREIKYKFVSLDKTDYQRDIRLLKRFKSTRLFGEGEEKFTEEMQKLLKYLPQKADSD